MQKITPFLWFDNNAEEAVDFYLATFKDANINSISRYGKENSAVSGMPAGSVMTIDFTLQGQEFTALNGGPAYRLSPAVSFVVPCHDQEEVDYLWERLSRDGQPSRCGWLTDKFGLTWQIVPRALMPMLQDQDTAKSQRVMQALLGMTKIDIAQLQRAYES